MDLLSVLTPWLQGLGGVGVVLGVIGVVIRIIGWGTSVTTLLGNHLRHDLADQTEEIRGLKRTTEHLTDTTDRLLDMTTEQTKVLRAVGYEIRQLRKDLNRGEPAAAVERSPQLTGASR